MYYFQRDANSSASWRQASKSTLVHFCWTMSVTRRSELTRVSQYHLHITLCIHVKLVLLRCQARASVRASLRACAHVLFGILGYFRNTQDNAFNTICIKSNEQNNMHTFKVGACFQRERDASAHGRKLLLDTFAYRRNMCARPTTSSEKHYAAAAAARDCSSAYVESYVLLSSSYAIFVLPYA